MAHTVILRVDGVDRTYKCDSYFDAIVLRDALETRYGAQNVEVWNGATRV